MIIAESPVWPLTKPPATLAVVAADVKAAVAAVGGQYLDISQPLYGLTATLGRIRYPTTRAMRRSPKRLRRHTTADWVALGDWVVHGRSVAARNGRSLSLITQGL